MSYIFPILMIFAAMKAGLYPDRCETVAGKWVVEKCSSLNIQGETNINNYQCDVIEYLNEDTLFYMPNRSTRKIEFSGSDLCIDIRKFDCHSKLITNDFRAALKADKNSSLRIKLISLDHFSDPCNTSQSVKGIVDITVADITQRTEICYTLKVLPENRIELKGSKGFTFSAFNLKAPRKMAGLVRARDVIKVNFRLFFRAI